MRFELFMGKWKIKPHFLFDFLKKKWWETSFFLEWPNMLHFAGERYDLQPCISKYTSTVDPLLTEDNIHPCRKPSKIDLQPFISTDTSTGTTCFTTFKRLLKTHYFRLAFHYHVPYIFFSWMFNIHILAVILNILYFRK